MIICTCFGCNARFSGRIELDFLIGIVSLEICKKLWQLNTDRTEFSSVAFIKRFRILQGMIYSLKMKQLSQTHCDADGCNFFRCIAISHLPHNF